MYNLCKPCNWNVTQDEEQTLYLQVTFYGQNTCKQSYVLCHFFFPEKLKRKQPAASGLIVYL